MSKSLSQLTAKTDQEDADIFLMRRGNVDYKQTNETLFDPLRYSGYIAAYDNAAIYSSINVAPLLYVLYNNLVWKVIEPAAFSGVAPDTDPTKWEKVFSTEMGHPKDGDDALASGTVNAVLASDIRTFLDDRADEAIIKKVELTLTAAQIKAMATTPIQLIAAPAAGVAIEMISASARLVYGTAAFTSSFLQIFVNGAANAQLATANTFLSQTSTRTIRFVEVGSVVGNSVTAAQAIKINANADSAVGDSTIKIYATYREITI